MGKKDLSKLSSGKPQNSFKELVSDASLEKLKPFIMDLFEDYKKEQVENFQGLYERLTTIERLFMKSTGTTNEQYTDLLADTQDEFYGFLQALDFAAPGDAVRVEVSTRTKDQTEFQGSSKALISNLGSGASAGKELEASIVGMKKGEVKEVEFGVEGGMVAKITLNRISRRK